MSQGLKDAIAACNVASYFSAIYADLEKRPSLPADLERRDLSYALFFQLCKIKYAAWRYRVNFNRGRRHGLAEVFQDLVAFYLRAALPPKYEVRLEESRKLEKHGKPVLIQPDICVKIDGVTQFVIEIKTTIGWKRPDFQASEEIAYKQMQQRIDDVAAAFAISNDRVIFLFEEPTNVSAKFFLPKFWDKNTSAPVDRPGKGILTQIYPLYMDTDPYYWRWTSQIPKGRNRRNWYVPDLPDDLILEKATQSIVTPFELVVELIQSSPVIPDYEL